MRIIKLSTWSLIQIWICLNPIPQPTPKKKASFPLFSRMIQIWIVLFLHHLRSVKLYTSHPFHIWFCLNASPQIKVYWIWNLVQVWIWCQSLAHLYESQNTQQPQQKQSSWGTQQDNKCRLRSDWFFGICLRVLNYNKQFQINSYQFKSQYGQMKLFIMLQIGENASYYF